MHYEAIKRGNPNKTEAEILQEKRISTPESRVFTKDELENYTAFRDFNVTRNESDEAPNSNYGTTVYVENSRNILFGWNPDPHQRIKDFIIIHILIKKQVTCLIHLQLLELKMYSY